MGIRLPLLAAVVVMAARVGAAPIAGIDHMPFVVRDLDRTQATIRQLGFSIKPGRPHDDGLRTALVKFPDGSGIELVTARTPVDALTRTYVELLQQGEGPAFFSLHIRDPKRLVAALKAADLPYDDRGDVPIVPLPGLEWLFFVGDNRSPTDRPEHFAHANGATAMSRVWVAPDDPAPLRRVLTALGATIESRKVAAPDPVDAEVAQLDNGEILILPPEHQLIPGRPIVGATFTARESRAPRRLHGLWIEFRAPTP